MSDKHELTVSEIDSLISICVAQLKKESVRTANDVSMSYVRNTLEVLKELALFRNGAAHV